MNDYDDEVGDDAAGESPEALFEALQSAVDADAGHPGFPRLAEAYRRAGQLDRAEDIAVAGLAEAPERLGGKVALALVMLEKGEVPRALEALEGILEDVPDVPSPSVEEAEPAEHRLFATPLALPSAALPHFDGSAAEADAPPEDLREEEIDDAFAAAESGSEDGPSADDLAEAAVRGVEATTADASDISDVSDEGDLADYRASGRPVFATRTMASLLEGQGDLAGADEVRASMVAELGASSDDEPDEPEALDAASAIASISQPIESEEPDARAEVRVRRQRIIARLEGWLENLRRDPA